ncbi:heavy metal translocating P-type ATPase [Limosilactobacillus mucosae]|uniref:heavy metal translocating P-type ATPase n=1 Tax=Limosilactobacillus mucosae TaxID=97478 RepID=UPI00233EE769|nr:heavy metal translocating P-type ATPase [Limosilactobacillus mucosae]MDC2839710.1 heavy metal translocating P-type ATPase [Limosilactobacillus mucosae]MDC2840410.1 heavy metal translocating P-type ATPase [Limosilactobacillus mucosae]MDC2844633.1 heavy metal translocating P-type ATPase [Limosilactobacillus mucosae]
MKKFSHRQKLFMILAVALVAVLLQYAFKQALAAQMLVTIVGAGIALSMLIEMIHTLKSGRYGVDLLAIVAVVSTLSVSEYWAAMVILVMLVGGDALEDYASRKANSELKALLDNSPQSAHRLVNDQIEDVHVDQVKVGDKIVVKPGELVPIDGEIIKGATQVNESSLTGESKPIDKQVGDPVMSGSLNGDQAIVIKAIKLARDSQYQKLVALVKEAENTPAHFVRLADRYAVPFTIAALIIGGIAWALTKDPRRFAEVMVVASPCPLILAAPVAIVSGMSRASRSGIIVKTGSVLEKMAHPKTVAFDKTGTITSGQLSVDHLEPAPGVDIKELLHFAASAEEQSPHILARSTVAYAQEHQIPLSSVSDLKEVVGNGILATVDGRQVKVGKLIFADPNTTQKPLSQTAIYVSVDSQYWGCVIFQDQIRPEAPRTMAQLRKLGVEHLVMLTGDQNAIAQHVAKLVGIHEIKADLLPEQKIAALKNVPTERRPVVMVGDGVNDAPALATADVGIAMGAHGSTAASESADLVIVKDDLYRVVVAVTISQETMKIAQQAVLIGIGICTALMLIAAFGIIPAFIGAMLQEVIDTVSILWALRARHGLSDIDD